MSIWKKEHDLNIVNSFNDNTLIENLGIKVTRFTNDGLVGTMPIDHRTCQPFKVLHGGASVVLAESLGSIGSNLLLDKNSYFAVGQSINANHINSQSQGEVTGKAQIIHFGRKSHVWEIKIYDDKEKLLCASRLTMAIIEK